MSDCVSWHRVWRWLCMPPALLSALPAGAVYLSSLVYDMSPDAHFVSRSLTNDTGRTNLYTLSVYQIDRPGKGGEHVLRLADKEVLYSPLKFTLADGKKEYFRLHYRGPQDDRERYYRVTFREAPVRLFPLRDQQKHLDILPVTALSSVLIVRPRDMRFAYTVDESTGIIRNTGNTYFRVIIHQGCKGNDEQATQFYMLPGEEYRDPAVSTKNKKFLVGPGGYVRLGGGCF